jgi:hypothetical protein
MNPTLKRLYWQLTALLLTTHFAGWSGGLPAVVALSGVQLAHVAIARCGQWRALDVQVRLAFFALLGLGTLPGMAWLHPMQFAGVNAVLVADYCLLARLLTLLPWNRQQALGWRFVRRVLLLPPAPGPITARLATAGLPADR